ncbi:MAG: hypothetical protein DHS20C10_12320 [marine bacterium B5-7]|nr:MAG: hypothetical protein DHS20C10_12320 [marine bacterium B5-7]
MGSTQKPDENEVLAKIRAFLQDYSLGTKPCSLLRDYHARRLIIQDTGIIVRHYVERGDLQKTKEWLALLDRLAAQVPTPENIRTLLNFNTQRTTTKSSINPDLPDIQQVIYSLLLNYFSTVSTLGSMFHLAILPLSPIYPDDKIRSALPPATLRALFFPRLLAQGQYAFRETKGLLSYSVNKNRVPPELALEMLRHFSNPLLTAKGILNHTIEGIPTVLTKDMKIRDSQLFDEKCEIYFPSQEQFNKWWEPLTIALLKRVAENETTAHQLFQNDDTTTFHHSPEAYFPYISRLPELFSVIPSLPPSLCCDILRHTDIPALLAADTPSDQQDAQIEHVATLLTLTFTHMFPDNHGCLLVVNAYVAMQSQAFDTPPVVKERLDSEREKSPEDCARALMHDWDLTDAQRTALKRILMVTHGDDSLEVRNILLNRLHIPQVQDSAPPPFLTTTTVTPTAPPWTASAFRPRAQPAPPAYTPPTQEQVAAQQRLAAQAEQEVQAAMARAAAAAAAAASMSAAINPHAPSAPPLPVGAGVGSINRDDEVPPTYDSLSIS